MAGAECGAEGIRVIAGVTGAGEVNPLEVGAIDHLLGIGLTEGDVGSGECGIGLAGMEVRRGLAGGEDEMVGRGRGAEVSLTSMRSRHG